MRVYQFRHLGKGASQSQQLRLAKPRNYKETDGPCQRYTTVQPMIAPGT